MRLIAVFIIAIPFGLQAQNQPEERWENYVKQLDKGIGGFTVRMDLADYAPIAGFSNLLKVTNYYTDKREDGFPSETAFDALSKITLDLLLSMNGKVSFVYAGSTTYDGASTEYIYVEETDDLKMMVEQFYTENFPKKKHDISITEDIIWKAYKNELYPSEQIVNYMNDKKVIKNLVDNGDDITVPRRIDHWLFFKTEEDMNAFGDRIQEYQFYVESIEDFNSKEWPIQLIIFREDEVSLENISEITNALRNLAAEHKGIYDGWGTNVIDK